MNSELVDNIGDSILRIKKIVNHTSLYDLFTQHPAENSLTYLEHFLKTMNMSMKMGMGTISLLIHAYCPFMCKKTGKNIISNLHSTID